MNSQNYSEAAGGQMTLFSQAASHNLVNHTAWQESDSEKMMNATCGHTCLEQFVKFDRVGLWAKMFSGLLIGMEGWYSKRCKLTWKLKGTKSNRMYFQLLPSTLRTEETGFGLLPTAMLPTPTAFDWNSARTEQKWEEDKKKWAEKGVNLQMPLKQMARLNMLPTPTAQVVKHGHSEKYWDNRIGKRQMDIGMWNAQTNGKTSQLNPRFVAEMMGFPPDWTILPFQSGETSPSKDMETP